MLHNVCTAVLLKSPCKVLARRVSSHPTCMGKHAFWMASFQCLAKSPGPQQLIFDFKEGQDQCTKKVVSDSLGLVDFAIRLVNSVFNLPDGQVMFYEEFE